jgi:hypothetical protein
MRAGLSRIEQFGFQSLLFRLLEVAGLLTFSGLVAKPCSLRLKAAMIDALGEPGIR